MNLPGCCSQSLDRSRMKAFLPSRHNGVGLRSWERTADFAWFASVASYIALEDDDFNFARKFLGSQSESAGCSRRSLLPRLSTVRDHSDWRT